MVLTRVSMAVILNFEKYFITASDYQRIYDEMGAAESEDAWEEFREQTVNEWFGLYTDGLGELGYSEIGDLETYDWLTFSYSQNMTMRNSDQWWAEHRDNPRIVAVHGFSRPVADAREHARLRYHGNSYIREFGENRKDAPFDKGHFIGHKLGGQIDNGIFAQRRDVNRGWQPHTGFYQMERYAQANPGVFVFCRPIYGDGSSCPFYIEYGILRTDKTWWVEVFPNRYSFTPFQGFDAYPAWRKAEIDAARQLRAARMAKIASAKP
jgi:hypothetical protein